MWGGRSQHRESRTERRREIFLVTSLENQNRPQSTSTSGSFGYNIPFIGLTFSSLTTEKHLIHPPAPSWPMLKPGLFLTAFQDMGTALMSSFLQHYVSVTHGSLSIHSLMAVISSPLHTGEGLLYYQSLAIPLLHPSLLKPTPGSAVRGAGQGSLRNLGGAEAVQLSQANDPAPLSEPTPAEPWTASSSQYGQVVRPQRPAGGRRRIKVSDEVEEERKERSSRRKRKPQPHLG